MYVQPPDRLTRSLQAARRRRRTRRALQWTVAVSVLLHLLLLAVLWPWQAKQAPQDVSTPSDDVAVVFQKASDKAASTRSENPAPQPSAAQGNPDGTAHPPVPTTSTQAPAAATPPVPEPAPQPPGPPAPTPPQQEASLQPPPQPAPPTPPQPETPPTPPTPEPPTPAPPQAQPPTPAPRQPPTVSLEPSDEGEQPVVPPFVMPQPPLPLPPLPPRPPPPPRRPPAVVQAIPRSPSGFPLPQNWSLASGSQSLLSQRGTDNAARPRGGRSNSELRVVSGTDPGEDWEAELRRWVERRLYYPPEAAEEGQDGPSVVTVTIDKYGRVTHMDLASSSGYPLLDMAWEGVWRGATAPPFPQGTPGDSVTLQYTLMYILHRR